MYSMDFFTLKPQGRCPKHEPMENMDNDSQHLSNESEIDEKNRRKNIIALTSIEPKEMSRLDREKIFCVIYNNAGQKFE